MSIAAEMTTSLADPKRATASLWPDLPLESWADTYSTLQRWMQIVGKTRLVLAPMQNHWWQVPLYVSARGLTTSPIPAGPRHIEVEFDFIDHALAIRASDGATRRMSLEPRSVADFYHKYLAELRALGVDLRMTATPNEMPDAMPFPTDETHASYDPDAAHRCWQILVQTDRVLKEFRGGFVGKASPVHVWWGGFDIACTRFSGRTAPKHAGGIPNLPDYVAVEAYSHECISAGWWPGSIGGPVAEPAFYAYSYPMPPGCESAAVKPEAAYYHQQMAEWILPYESVRSAADPDAMLLDFLHSTYDAAAERARWDRKSLERPQGWSLDARGREPARR